MTLDEYLKAAGVSKKDFNELSANAQKQIRTFASSDPNDPATQSTYLAPNQLKNWISTQAKAGGLAPVQSPEQAKQGTVLLAPGQPGTSTVVQGTGKNAQVATLPSESQSSGENQMRLAGISETQIQLLRDNGFDFSNNGNVQTYVQSFNNQQANTLYGLNPDLANQQIIMNRAFGPTPPPPGVGRNRLDDTFSMGQPDNYKSYYQALAEPGTTGFDVGTLQTQLAAADPSYKIEHPGLYDLQTQSAYQKILQEALQLHMTPQEVLQFEANSAKKKAADSFKNSWSFIQGENIAAPAEMRADPAEVMQRIQSNFQQSAGRKASSAELKAMTKTWRDFEDKAHASSTAEATYRGRSLDLQNLEQAAAQNAIQAGQKTPAYANKALPAAPVLQSFNPEAEAANQARSLSPFDVGTQDLRNALGGFMDALRAG